MTIVSFSPANRTEASAFLKSAHNQIAEKAHAFVRAGRPVSELRELLSHPCASHHVTRDPANPRKSFLLNSLIDACADGTGEVAVTEECRIDRVTLTLGVDERVRGLSVENQNRVECLRFLLSAGFTPGSNGWRGAFLPFIIGHSLRNPGDAFLSALASVAIEHLKSRGVKALQMTSEYLWFHNASTLRQFLQAGGSDDKDEAIRVAICYLDCAPSHGSSPEDRMSVIKALAELGARVTGESLADLVFPHTAYQKRLQLRSAGLAYLLEPREADAETHFLFLPENNEASTEIRRLSDHVGELRHRATEPFNWESVREETTAIFAAVHRSDLKPFEALVAAQA